MGSGHMLPLGYRSRDHHSQLRDRCHLPEARSPHPLSNVESWAGELRDAVPDVARTVTIAISVP